MRVINIKDLEQVDVIKDGDKLVVQNEDTARIGDVKDLKDYLYDNLGNVSVNFEEASSDVDIESGNIVSVLFGKIRKTIKSFRTRITNTENNLNSEITRAKAAEKTNSDAISSEVSRATAKENEISNNLSSEITRATTSETGLRNDLNSEISRAKSEEKTLADNLSAEITRAKSAEKVNADAISGEATRATNAETALTNNLNAEVNRATTAENNLESKKANIASPAFIGTPTTPTASSGTNTTQIATTAFVQTAVSNHNSSSTAHADIRDLITGLTTRLNTLADSDDTTLDQLSEVVAYIKSNRTLIENITTNKVNVADIVDNLTSTATNKPLSAKQGKVLNDLIATLGNTVNTKVDKVNGKGLSTNDLSDTLKSNYDTAYIHSQSAHARTDATKVEKSTTNGNVIINGTETNVYTHPSGTNPHGTTKSDVGLGNVGNFKAVSTVANQGLNDTEKSNARANIGAADLSHTHNYLPLSGGTVTGATQFNNYLKLNAWTNYGTGTANFWYDANNKFVEIQNATDLKLAGTKVSKEGHTHSSYVNQNAFSNVVVGSTTIAADSATDTLTLVAGSNITITPDATNDKITISATDTNTHYTSKNVVGSSTATSNTTTALTNGNVYLNSVENGAVTSTHKISGSGATTVTTDASGNIIISSTDTNTNTTYSAGTGLSLSGTTFNHKNSVTAGTAQGDASKTLTFGGTFTIPTVTYDAQGHVTGKGTTTMTMPANPNTWRGIQNNLTSTSTTDSLSANQGRLLANGSARDSTKLPLTGGTMTGGITMNYGLRIGQESGGDLYIGNANNSGWLVMQDAKSQASTCGWKLHQAGTMEILSCLTVGTMEAQSNYSIQGTTINAVNGLTVGGKATMKYNSSTDSIDFIFS